MPRRPLLLGSEIQSTCVDGVLRTGLVAKPRLKLPSNKTAVHSGSSLLDARPLAAAPKTDPKALRNLLQPSRLGPLEMFRPAWAALKGPPYVIVQRARRLGEFLLSAALRSRS